MYYRPYQMGSVLSVAKNVVKTVSNPITPFKQAYKTTEKSLNPSLITIDPIKATEQALITSIDVAKAGSVVNVPKGKTAEEIKKEEAMKRHAELVRQGTAASAAKSAESAGRASAQEAQYAAEQRAMASARGAAKASQQASEAVSKKVQIANLRKTTDKINADMATQAATDVAVNQPDTANDVVNAGAMAQNAAANDREAQEIAVYMPQQNDYTKWLLIGGGALLLLMLLKKGKK